MPGRPIGSRPTPPRPTTLTGRFGPGYGQPSLTPVPIGGLRTRPLTPVPPLELRDGVYRNADPRYNDGRRYDGRDGDRRGYDGRGGYDPRGYDRGGNDKGVYDKRGPDGRGYDGRRGPYRGYPGVWIGAPYLGGLFLRNGLVVYAGSAYASSVVQSSVGVTVQDDADVVVEPARRPPIQPRTIMLTPVPDGDRVWYPTMDKPSWRVDSTLAPVQAWRDLIVRDAVCDSDGNCREREQKTRAPWVATCRCYVLTDAVGRRWEIP